MSNLIDYSGNYTINNNNKNMIFSSDMLFIVLTQMPAAQAESQTAGICEGPIKKPTARKNHVITIFIITYPPNLENIINYYLSTITA